MPKSFQMVRMLFLLMALTFACKPPVQEQHTPAPDPIRDQFVKVNRYMHRRHQDHIAAFVERVGWKAEVTPSGLWIVEEASGTGPVIAAGNRVTYTFSSTLLDGRPAYRTTGEAPKEIVIGQGGVESGVEEGLRHLQAGSTATLIIPPHLAHGNFGDRGKIPGNTVLIYHLEIKDVR